MKEGSVPPAKEYENKENSTYKSDTINPVGAMIFCANLQKKRMFVLFMILFVCDPLIVKSL